MIAEKRVLIHSQHAYHGRIAGVDLRSQWCNPQDSNMPQFNDTELTAAVIRSFEETPDPRVKFLMEELVKSLHDYVRRTDLTFGEWEYAIDFLTRTGQKCTPSRQEFILLSDVLGMSMLTETISNRKFGVATESTVLGPFHVVESPVRELGDNIDLVGTGTPCVVTGRVVSVDGAPLPGATLDVWQANDQGFYDVQQPDVQPRTNGRGLFTADDKGEFWFRTIVPSFYPIPTDGPVGELLTSTGRHAFRPAHIHFIVAAPGHRPLTTHIFVAGQWQVGKVPFRRADFDIIMQPGS